MCIPFLQANKQGQDPYHHWSQDLHDTAEETTCNYPTRSVDHQHWYNTAEHNNWNNYGSYNYGPYSQWDYSYPPQEHDYQERYPQEEVLAEVPEFFEEIEVEQITDDNSVDKTKEEKPVDTEAVFPEDFFIRQFEFAVESYLNFKPKYGFLITSFYGTFTYVRT